MNTPCSKRGLSRPGACGNDGVCVNHEEIGQKAGHCICGSDLHGPNCTRLGSLGDSPSPVTVFSHFRLAGFEQFEGHNQDQSVFITASQLWWEDKRLLGVLEDGEYTHVTGDLQHLKAAGLLWMPEIQFPIQSPALIRETPPIINATLNVTTSSTASSDPTVILSYEANHRIEKEHLLSWHTFPFDKEILHVHMQLAIGEQMTGIDAIACCNGHNCGLPAGTYTNTARHIVPQIVPHCPMMRGTAA